MREDIDFDIIDTQIEKHLAALEWQTENPTIQFSFNLALESLRDHEIDRCVWTLKKSVETSVDGEGIAHAVFQLLVKTELYSEALEVFAEAIDREFEDPAIIYNYAYCLHKVDKDDEAEQFFAILLEDDHDKYSSLSLDMLGVIRNQQGRVFEAKALNQEAISIAIRLEQTVELGILYWNKSFYCQKLAFYDEAIAAAQLGKKFNTELLNWSERIQELEKLVVHLDDEDEIEVDVEGINTYEDWFVAGSFWHMDIPKDFFYGTREFLEELYKNGATWADESNLLFSDFWLEEDSLEESLARVESLSDHFHLQPTWPVYLETPDISIAMTINRNFLLAWVGVGLEGLLVGVNVKSWDVYHAVDTDARFAIGASLNWFIDCSLNIATHEMFFRTPNRWREIERPWEPKYLTTWSTTNLFHEDIENIRRYEDRNPPRAHRVRGHIRTLIERQPTDEARENAPAYIRQNMGPTDTFVRSYTKSGEIGTDKLLDHLSTRSSLADFLGTAPLFESD